MGTFQALKIETEAEGASWSAIKRAKKFAELHNLPLYLKIGGVEAKTDIRKASDLAIGGIIAPMVESLFALEKFDDASRNLNFKWRALTIESITAFRDIEAIASEAKNRGISGLTFGRGDFSASLGIKGSEDSNDINAYAQHFIDVAHSEGLPTSIGGNLTKKSILNLRQANLSPTYIESRRVIIPWTNSGPNEMITEFENAINFEKSLLESEIDSLKQKIEMNQDRILLLNSRLNTN